MKLAILTTDSVPIIGGVSEYLHGLMSATLNEVDWRLWSAVPGKHSEDCALPYHVQRFMIRPRALGTRMGDDCRPIRRLNTLRWRLQKRNEGLDLLNRVIAEGTPDAVVIGRWCEDAHGWCLACRERKIPYILMTYGMELLEPVPWPASQLRVSDLKGARVVFGCSTYTIELVDKITQSAAKTAILFPGIYPEKLQSLSESYCREVLAGFGLEKAPFVLAMGRLVRRKGFDLAVKAFGKIAEKFPTTRLVIAGDGEDRDLVKTAMHESRFSSRIEMLGEVSDIQKRALLQSCEFFVMPNRPVPDDMEGLGIVFLEANFFGRAVIGGNNGGVPDAVVHRETGLLVDSEDLQALAGAMEKLLTDVSFRFRLGENGKERVLKRFCWSNLAKNFLNQLPRAVNVSQN